MADNARKSPRKKRQEVATHKTGKVTGRKLQDCQQSNFSLAALYLQQMVLANTYVLQHLQIRWIILYVLWLMSVSS